MKNKAICICFHNENGLSHLAISAEKEELLKEIDFIMDNLNKEKERITNE